MMSDSFIQQIFTNYLLCAGQWDKSAFPDIWPQSKCLGKPSFFFHPSELTSSAPSPWKASLTPPQTALLSHTSKGWQSGLEDRVKEERNGPKHPRFPVLTTLRTLTSSH